jgi:hypothetical protein
MMASIVAGKPSTTIFEKKAKVISKNIPAITHSFNLNNLFGTISTTTPDNLATPSM